MKLFPSLGAAALLLTPVLTARAQASPSLARDRQWHLDLAMVGASAGFAARTSERRSFGVELGAGGNWVNHVVFSDGGHFTRGGTRNNSVIELVHATVFVRTHFSEARHLDVGLKGSGFLHFDSSDDEPGGGYFVGLNAKYSWARWRRLSFASEMDIGRYAEPGDSACISGCAGVSEAAVTVAPILVRFSVP